MSYIHTRHLKYLTSVIFIWVALSFVWMTSPVAAYESDEANQLVTDGIYINICLDVIDGDRAAVLKAVKNIPAGSTLADIGLSESTASTLEPSYPLTTSIYDYYKSNPPMVGICDVGEKTFNWAKTLPTLVVENEEEGENDESSAGSDDEEFQSSCSIDGIGWIVCPVMNFIAGINDAALGFLSENFLFVDPELLTNDSTQAAWSGFRDIANALFVIAFLVILYSQMTGSAVSNYGIKRMLPRLIIAAVLVNISYYICQLAVDVSNIVGNSIADLLGTSMPTATADEATIGNTDLPAWKDITAGILIAGTALVGIALLIAIGLPALLAFAMIVLVLIARKAIMILLVVVAPIAFVAYLLPNTESFFKKWWKLFSTMLMLYPIIGIVFGASLLAAKVINNTAGSDVLLQLTALGVIALPLFAVPVLLKGAMAATGTIGTRLNSLSDRANKRATGNIKSGRSGEAIGAFQRRRAERKINRRVGDGKLGKLNSAVDRSRLGRYIGGDRGAARAVAEQHKMVGEQVENSMALLQNGDAGGLVDRAKDQLERANETGDVVAARAATKILASQTGSRGVDGLHATIAKIESSKRGLHGAVGENIKHDINSASLKGKDRALDLWARDEKSSEGITTLGGYDTHTETARGLNEGELAGQSKPQLQRLSQSGSMTQQQARGVLHAHESGTIHLDPGKLSIFTERANSGRVENVGEAQEQATVENSLRDSEQSNPSQPRNP